jgi:hypothetical protein
MHLLVSRSSEASILPTKAQPLFPSSADRFAHVQKKVYAVPTNRDQRTGCTKRVSLERRHYTLYASPFVILYVRLTHLRSFRSRFRRRIKKAHLPRYWGSANGLRSCYIEPGSGPVLVARPSGGSRYHETPLESKPHRPPSNPPSTTPPSDSRRSLPVLYQDSVPLPNASCHPCQLHSYNPLAAGFVCEKHKV